VLAVHFNIESAAEKPRRAVSCSARPRSAKRFVSMRQFVREDFYPLHLRHLDEQVRL
jgi:hypothetical protein